MSSKKQPDSTFPKNIDTLTKEDCAKILRKALAVSQTFDTQKQLALATGIPQSSLSHYFSATHKPTQQKWDILGNILIAGETKKLESQNNEQQPARRAAEKLSALLFLLKEELEFFKNGPPQYREILKKTISGDAIGKISGLLIALYDEDQLDAYKIFTDMNQEID